MMRFFTILAAVFMVLAVGLAATSPADLSLADAVSVLNVMAIFEFQEYATHHLPPWVWVDLASPWLMRPAWLLPAFLSILAGGGALTLSGRLVGRKR